LRLGALLSVGDQKQAKTLESILRNSHLSLLEAFSYFLMKTVKTHSSLFAIQQPGQDEIMLSSGHDVNIAAMEKAFNLAQKHEEKLGRKGSGLDKALKSKVQNLLLVKFDGLEA